MSDQPDFRQEFTNRVIAAIESGETLPWERTWAAGGSPRNAVSDKEYNGANRLMLGMSMIDAGRSDPRFVTFKQALDLGGSIRKGEKGAQIERYEVRPFYTRKDVEITRAGSPVKIESDAAGSVRLEDGATVSKSELVIHHDGKPLNWNEARALDAAYSKVFTVFNVEQCDNLTKLPPLPQQAAVPTDERFDSIKAAMLRDGLKIEHVAAGQAFYRPSTDTVTLPPAGSFHTTGDYQSVALHEIGHATGAVQRLNRDGITGQHSFGSAGYAKEELRAELFSAFMAMETGINRARDEQHTAYLKSWSEALKDSKHEIFKAAADASRAVDYVRGKERELALGKTSEVKQEKPLKKAAGLAL